MKRRDATDRQAIQAFGDRLTELRLMTSMPNGRAFMQRKDAAVLAGISAAQWSRLERGVCDPSLTSMLRIQAALGLDSIETLLGSAPSRKLAGAKKPPSGHTSIDDMSG
jgi:transcriptional regulator with XRE-family HTH domain